MKDTTSSQHFLLNTGARIPAVGLGTWQTGGDVCSAAVRAALDVGYRHFDCAHLYGNELEVGQALSEALAGGLPGLQREDLFVTSKLLISTNTSKRVEAAIQVSLKNLNLSYLDLYLLHWPASAPVGDATDPPFKHGKSSPRIKEAWQAMEGLVEKGLVRAIGVSNFSIAQVEELLTFAKIVPAVNQVELHPFWRQDELVKLCVSKNIHVSAHTPLGVPGSNLKSMENETSGGEHELISPGLPVVFTRSHSVHLPMLKMSTIEVIAERLEKTSAQILVDMNKDEDPQLLGPPMGIMSEAPPAHSHPAVASPCSAIVRGYRLIAVRPSVPYHPASHPRGDLVPIWPLGLSIGTLPVVTE